MASLILGFLTENTPDCGRFEIPNEERRKCPDVRIGICPAVDRAAWSEVVSRAERLPAWDPLRRVLSLMPEPPSSEELRTILPLLRRLAEEVPPAPRAPPRPARCPANQRSKEC